MRADTIILADKAYDSNAIRAKAKERGVWANIPPKRNRKASVTFSKWVYKQRNAVERFFNKIKQFRAIANRYEKKPAELSGCNQTRRSTRLDKKLMSLRPRKGQSVSETKTKHQAGNTQNKVRATPKNRRTISTTR